jgi:hypothetical protein
MKGTQFRLDANEDPDVRAEKSSICRGFQRLQVKTVLQRLDKYLKKCGNVQKVWNYSNK